MHINKVTCEKLKTPLKVNGNLNFEEISFNTNYYYYYYYYYYCYYNCYVKQKSQRHNGNLTQLVH